MDFGAIISAALGLFGNIATSKDQTIQANDELQAKVIAAKTAVQQLASHVEEKEIDLSSITVASQADINKIDAQSSDKYQSRWRPTIGWVCASGLAYVYLLKPVIMSLMSLAVLCGANASIVNTAATVLPNLDVGTLMGLVIPLLGLGAYRSVEKVMGTKQS